MRSYFTVDINLQEDVIIGDFAGKEDQASTLPYIAGSAIRGAVIYALKHKHQLDDAFLLDNIIVNEVCFLNGYKIENDTRSIPTPLCFVADKVKQRMKVNSAVKNVLLLDDAKSDEQRVRIKTDGFIQTLGKDIYPVKIKKRDALHIKTRNRVTFEKQKNSDVQMFRLEALRGGQKFRAYVATENEKALELLKLVLKEDAELFLGASRGNGYGKCLIQNVQISYDNPEMILLNKGKKFENKNKCFYLIYLSDFLYLNDQGHIQSLFDISHLNEALGVSCKFEGITTEPKIVTGFNAKIGGRLPQFSAAKMGTVVKYSYEGTLDTERVQSFTDISYGLRSEEGFGRVALVEDFYLDNIIFDQSIPEKVNLSPVSLTSKEKEFLLTISESIYEKRFENNILKFALEKKQDDLNTTQLSKWMGVFERMKGLDSKSGMSYLDKIIRHTEESTNETRKSQLNTFLNLEICEGIKISDWLLKANHKSVLEKSKVLPISPEIGGVSYALDSETSYQWVLKLLIKLFYQDRR